MWLASENEGRMKHQVRRWMVAAVGACASGCLPVFAADTTAPEATPTEGALEEIVVTAEHREENSQKTPISMSVYSAKDLQEEGVHDIQSLTRIDPSVNITTSTGSAYIAVRGIASTDLTETGDPAVAVSRDGFFTNRGYGLFSSLYDVERIEVLKGPQGTLYGRNSVGGEINIITQRPTDSFGGYVSAEAGSYDMMNLEGALNLPLSDIVQARISAVSRYHEGYRDNPGFPNGDDEDNKSVRFQLQVAPWEKFKGWFSVQTDRTQGTGDVADSGPIGTSGPGVANGVTPPIPYNLAGGFPLYAAFSNHVNETRYRWEFSQGLPGELNLTYLGGYDQTTWNHALDATTYPGTSNPPAQFLQVENPTTQNHELRLTSDPTARVFWQAGAFYFREINSPLNSYLLEEGGTFDGQKLIDFNYAVDTTSKAGFGQLTFVATDELRFTGGLRYTKDHKERTGASVLDLTVASGGFLSIPAPPGCSTAPGDYTCTHILVTTPSNGNIDSTKLTFHGGVDWTPTPTTLVYAKYDTGYKAGGFNSNGSAPSVNYDPETVKSLEIGTKNRFLDERLQANLSIFDMKYDGYQASQTTHVISGSATGIFNAGDANDFGAEAELVAVIDPLTKADINLTLLHAKFNNGTAVDSSTGVSPPLDGNFLPNAPTASLHAGIERSLIDPTGARWTARLEGKYQSRIYFDIFNHLDTSQAGYATADALLNYAPSQGHWSVQTYVRNISDKAILQNAARNGVSEANTYEFAPPRTYGIKVIATF
jgi:iron complex outermembrane receptor protein